MPLPTESTAARRSVMFSPIFAIVSAMSSATLRPPILCDLIFSTSAPASSATCAIILTRPWNWPLRATKSVSELTSTTTPLVPAVSAPISPSAATRPAFFAAFDNPFWRSQSCAACMSPDVSVRAALQSIIPAPVDSRRSLTIAAVIVAIAERPFAFPDRVRRGSTCQPPSAIRLLKEEKGMAGGSGHPIALFRFRGERLGACDPGVRTARQADLFADLVRGIVIELGELPVMENAEIVELLLDRTGNARKLLEVVGGAARTGESLESRRCRGRDLFGRRLCGRADIDARVALRTRDAVDRSTRDEIAIERDRASRIVIAGHDVGDALRIGVGVDDRRNGDVEALRLGNRDVFLVGVDHEDHIGQTAHVLDPAERAVELV